jgi:Fe-Mn family superoxide dismutase
MAFTLNPLPYAYDALEPSIDARTMEIHHDKHAAAYCNNLNAALEKAPEFADRSLDDLLAHLDQLPESVRTAIRNNGGGHWNHSFFWEILSPKSSGAPSGGLADDIHATFGSFDAFKEKFNAAGLSRFGSGWAWLIVRDGKLEVTSTPNQDNPLMDVAEVKGTPILGVDVWEHAYYLKYQNKRADYLGAFWKVINWDKVNEHYTKAK